jgi:hypothetical protein
MEDQALWRVLIKKCFRSGGGDCCGRQSRRRESSFYSKVDFRNHALCSDLQTGIDVVEKATNGEGVEYYVKIRIILFSIAALSAIPLDVHARSIPALAVLFLGLTAQTPCSQAESILPLDPPRRAALPFRKGDQLEIQGDTSAAFTRVTRITVLDATNWPWVLVQVDHSEVWLNFDHVVMAKNVATSK